MLTMQLMSAVIPYWDFFHSGFLHCNTYLIIMEFPIAVNSNAYMQDTITVLTEFLDPNFDQNPDHPRN